MIYLDNGATSFPKPEQVYKRMDFILRNIGGNPGRASHRMALDASRVVFECREALSGLLSVADASRIVFTKNATEGINIALKGISLKAGAEVVTTSFEHNSVAKTLRRLEKDGVVIKKLRPDKEGFIDPADVERAVTTTTRLVCVTHASNVFGAIQPVAEIGDICHKKGVPFMVDGAQTVGAVPIDLARVNIDMLAGTGHKALFGPQGTGFLYLRDGVEPEPLLSGGTGELDLVLETPERFEAGTLNTPGIGGLNAGIDFVMQAGVKGIRRHEVALLKRLLSGLAAVPGINILGPLDPSKRVSLVAFNIDGMKPGDVGRRLDEEFGILVRTGVHCAPEAHKEALTYPEGAVRVSPGFFNTESDINEFLIAIDAISGRFGAKG